MAFWIYVNRADPDAPKDGPYYDLERAHFEAVKVLDHMAQEGLIPDGLTLQIADDLGELHMEVTARRLASFN